MDTYHFCDREETQRGSVAESGTGGLSKRGIYEEDRALSEEPGYREHLSVPGIGGNAGVG